MAAKWMNQLDQHYPQLGDKARALNKRDDYKMRYDPVQVKKRDDAKAKFKQTESKKEGHDRRDIQAQERMLEQQFRNSELLSDDDSGLVKERLSKHQNKPRRDDMEIITIEKDSSFFTMKQEKHHDSKTETTSSEVSNSYLMSS